MLLLGYIQQHQLGSFFFLMNTLAVLPVNYGGSVFIPFSVRNDNGHQMTTGLGWAVLPQFPPWCHC